MRKPTAKQTETKAERKERVVRFCIQAGLEEIKRQVEENDLPRMPWTFQDYADLSKYDANNLIGDAFDLGETTEERCELGNKVIEGIDRRLEELTKPFNAGEFLAEHGDDEHKEVLAELDELCGE